MRRCIAQRDGSPWMAAGLAKRTILYVSNGNGVVNVYEYWTHKLVGVLTQFTQPAGECVDKSGDVYIVDYQAKTISEYAHGGKKPIEVIRDSYQPLACSVDREISPARIMVKRTPIDHFSACAYDDRGDLLASSSNGYSGHYYGDFDYLPKKSKNILSMNPPGRRALRVGNGASLTESRTTASTGSSTTTSSIGIRSILRRSTSTKSLFLGAPALVELPFTAKPRGRPPPKSLAPSATTAKQKTLATGSTPPVAIHITRLPQTSTRQTA